MPTRLLALALLLAAAPLWAQTPAPFPASLADAHAPIIDVHLHAGPGSATSQYYVLEDGETPDAAYLRTLLADLDRHGVVRGIVGGPPAHAERFRRAAPERLIGSVVFPCTDGYSPNRYRCFEAGGDWPDLDWLRGEVEAGRIGALGELYNVYAGVSPLDPRMEPYFALAAEHDLVVLTHADTGPPPEARVPGCCPRFDEAHARPSLYRPILEKHPELRLVLLHTFRPEHVEEAIALMDDFPNVYVETSPMTRVPAPLVHAALARIVEAGHADRIVFGSDYLGAVGGSLAVIEAAPALTEQQRRAIYYDNAARLLGLDASDTRSPDQR